MAFIATSLQISWGKNFRNVCWVVLYQTYTFSPNLSNWLVVMAAKKINSSEAIWGINLKLCSKVHSISFYKKILFLLLLHMHFGCYGILKFPQTYNGENKNWHLLLFHCRYFDESFYKCLLSGPLPNMYFLSNPLDLIDCHGNQKAQFTKKK